MNLGKMYVSTVVASLVFVLTGCGSDSNTNTVDTGVKLSASDIAKKSSADYSNNDFGLVSASKVANWITDWTNNKPLAIQGKLVVLMVGKIDVGDVNANYLKGDGQNVLVYEASSLLGSTITRNDGVSDISKAFYDGKRMDEALMQTGIDPNKDMLLFVQGNASKQGKNLLNAARMWMTFAYWGVMPEHMALLNGNASYVLNPSVNNEITVSKTDIYDINQTVLPNNGTASIKDIRRDGTVIQATMKEMMDLVDGDANDTYILDVRSADEFNGVKRAKTELKICGENKDAQCYTPFDGHIKGASNLVFSSLLDMTTASDLNGDGNITDVVESSFVFKSQSVIEELFANAGYENGDALYVYCRTGTKASLGMFGASQIMGYPTRIYDGGWIQWGKMAHREDANGSTLIPEKSPWRTDIDKYSEAITYNGATSTVHITDPSTLNLDAETTNVMVQEDTNYKAQ
jgi:3-mercaptopyruvate sulfurtransferase SseA